MNSHLWNSLLNLYLVYNSAEKNLVRFCADLRAIVERQTLPDIHFAIRKEDEQNGPRSLWHLAAIAFSLLLPLKNDLASLSFEFRSLSARSFQNFLHLSSAYFDGQRFSTLYVEVWKPGSKADDADLEFENISQLHDHREHSDKQITSNLRNFTWLVKEKEEEDASRHSSNPHLEPIMSILAPNLSALSLIFDLDYEGGILWADLETLLRNIPLLLKLEANMRLNQGSSLPTKLSQFEGSPCSHLRILNLEGSSPSIFAFLRSFCLPSLKDMRVTLVEFDTVRNFHSVGERLPLPSLRNLYLSRSCRATHFIASAAELPPVKHFLLETWGRIHDVPSFDMPTLIPSPEVLVVRGSIKNLSSELEYVNMQDLRELKLSIEEIPGVLCHWSACDAPALRHLEVEVVEFSQQHRGSLRPYIYAFSGFKLYTPSLEVAKLTWSMGPRSTVLVSISLEDFGAHRLANSLTLNLGSEVDINDIDLCFLEQIVSPARELSIVLPANRDPSKGWREVITAILALQPVPSNPRLVTIYPDPLPMRYLRSLRIILADPDSNALNRLIPPLEEVDAKRVRRGGSSMDILISTQAGEIIYERNAGETAPALSTHRQPRSERAGIQEILNRLDI